MILDVVNSKDGVPIRLTDERWEHIVERRLYMTSYYEAMLDAVAQPEYILPGHDKSLIAVISLGRRTFLHVVYKELSRTDGFIISAYVKPTLDKNKIIWRADDQ
jgi:hypothetical protein